VYLLVLVGLGVVVGGCGCVAVDCAVMGEERRACVVWLLLLVGWRAAPKQTFRNLQPPPHTHQTQPNPSHSLLRVQRLDAEQHPVRVRQHRVPVPVPRPLPRRVQRRRQTHGVRLPEQRGRELGLQQGLAAAAGEAALGGPQVGEDAADLLGQGLAGY